MPGGASPLQARPAWGAGGAGGTASAKRAFGKTGMLERTPSVHRRAPSRNSPDVTGPDAGRVPPRPEGSPQESADAGRLSVGAPPPATLPCTRVHSLPVLEYSIAIPV